MNIDRNEPRRSREVVQRWLTSVIRHWPLLIMVAVAAAIGFVLAGPTAAASAAPPPTNSTPDSDSDEPSRAQKFVRKVNGILYEISYDGTVDPNDPHFKKKVAARIIVKRLTNRVGGGNVGVPSVSEIPGLLDDIVEYATKSSKTVDGLKKRVSKTQGDIEQLKKKVVDAETPRDRARAEKDLRDAQARYNRLFRDYQKAKKQAQPFDWKAEVNRLGNRVRDLERAAKNPRLTEAGRKQAQKQLDNARQELAKAQTERDRLQGPDDESGGTRPVKRGPTQPPKGPTLDSKKVPGPTKVASKGTIPKMGQRGRGTGTSAVIGDLFGQAYMEHLSKENAQLMEDAVKDPALRKRIIDDYNQMKNADQLEVLKRGFDTSKGFTQGASREIGPKLVEYQKMLDSTKAKADKSNADPLYQQARRECGGYDTCVRERVKKLRDQNARDIAKSTENARK
ncbi:hypothetical protein ACWDV4_22385, partial [Micromonospora sp. NPDC003197]